MFGTLNCRVEQIFAATGFVNFRLPLRILFGFLYGVSLGFLDPTPRGPTGLDTKSNNHKHLPNDETKAQKQAHIDPINKQNRTMRRIMIHDKAILTAKARTIASAEVHALY